MPPEKTDAYLDGFEHDVFISYAHQDNGEGWIEDFRKTLMWRIDHHLGCRGKLSVFRDEDSLRRNQLVTHSLRWPARRARPWPAWFRPTT